MAKTATAEKEAKKTTKKKATVKKAAKTGKKYLVIVESPAKAADHQANFWGTITKSKHPWDMCVIMPKSQMGIDLEHDFEPKYITIRGKGDILGKLRKEVQRLLIRYTSQLTRTVRGKPFQLASASRAQIWVRKNAISRITFNEITKNGSKRIHYRSTERSTWIWWMHSRRAVYLTAWWAILSVTCFGKK